MEFKDRLKAIRKEKGMTQKDASWEQGRTEPDIKMIKKLCKIYEVSSDYLLGISDEKNQK